MTTIWWKNTLEKILQCKVHKPEKITNQEKYEILNYLSERFTYFTRSQWKEVIKKGEIFVNYKPANENLILNNEDLIQFQIPIEYQYEPPVDDSYQILYEDNYILIVNKSGDLPIHPAGRYQKNTLLTFLEKTYTKLYPIHRLDRETSGIVLFAKDEHSAKKLSWDFKNKKVRKTYLVWVYGNFPNEYYAKGFLAKDDQSFVLKKLKFHESNNGNVETKFLKIGNHNGISLLIAKPITGKTHQIRATLSSLGYPIVGDKIYGLRDTAFLDFIKYGNTQSLIKELGWYRQALHALSLELCHPHSRKWIEFVSPFPNITF